MNMPFPGCGVKAAVKARLELTAAESVVFNFFTGVLEGADGPLPAVADDWSEAVDNVFPC